LLFDTKLQSIECIVVLGEARSTEVKDEHMRAIGIAPLAWRRSNYAFASCRKSRDGQEDLMSRRSGRPGAAKVRRPNAAEVRKTGSGLAFVRLQLGMSLEFIAHFIRNAA